MKEADIRPADIFAEYLRLSAADAKNFFSSTDRKVVPCPGCGSFEHDPAFSKEGFAYTVCKICATLYQSPRPPMAEFARFYADSPSSHYWATTFFPAVAEARRSRIFAPRVEQISGLCRDRGVEPRVVMDVGGGYGIFLEEWRRRHPESHVCTVEPGGELAEICRKRGIEVLETVAEEAQAWAGRADLVTCFEVIEHVFDSQAFLQALRRLVRPGGWVVVSGLGVDGFDIQVLWERSNSVSPPHHINFMSVKGFHEAFSRAGFDQISVLTPGKLDVDIVLGELKKNARLSMSRFERTLLSRGEEAMQDLQAFLAKHQLSSHSWVMARAKPEEK